MKVTLEPYSGGKYELQDDAEHIEVTIALFKQALEQCGYEPSCIEKYFTDYNESEQYNQRHKEQSCN